MNPSAPALQGQCQSLQELPTQRAPLAHRSNLLLTNVLPMAFFTTWHNLPLSSPSGGHLPHLSIQFEAGPLLQWSSQMATVQHGSPKVKRFSRKFNLLPPLKVRTKGQLFQVLTEAGPRTMLVTLPRPSKILQRADRAGSTEGRGMCSLTGVSPV